MKKAVRELLCQDCEAEYPIWYCDHFLWNPLAIELEREFGVPIHFLCLNCSASHITRMVKKVADAIDPSSRSVVWKLEIGSSCDIEAFFRATPNLNRSPEPCDATESTV